MHILEWNNILLVLRLQNKKLAKLFFIDYTKCKSYRPTKQEVAKMINATSCGGVVIFRGKVLLLYKNYRNKYEGWVLPKGTVERGETYEETALREVLEESGAKANIIKYIGKSEYSFSVPENVVEKEVHWYLMMADSYYSKPQREEYFVDSGFYKYHEAYHLLRFPNEKQILEKAYREYTELKRKGQL